MHLLSEMKIVARFSRTHGGFSQWWARRCKREATAANLERFRRLAARDYAPANDPKRVPFKRCFLMNVRPDDDLM